MTTETEQRAYGELRAIIERHGGTMVYQRAGYQFGAWVITLHGKTAVIASTGQHAFPQLDRLYVPKIVHPKTWDDYRDELLEDAEDHVLALLD